MASLDRHQARNCFRVRYTIDLKDKRIRRARYAKTRAEANIIMGSASSLEAATRGRVATADQIEDWIDDGLISEEEVGICFPGFRAQSDSSTVDDLATTDYDQILTAYEEQALRNSKAKDPARRTHLNTIARAKRVIGWLRGTYPDLSTLSVDNVLQYSDELDQHYAPWTRYHNLTALRLLLDQAFTLRMISDNPARDKRIPLGQPKTANVRQVLSLEEVRYVLEASLRYRRPINGCLPTIVRHGLYAGLRPEEMRWSMWRWLNPVKKTLSVQKSVCTVNGEVWVPKDYESRILDVKDQYVEYMLAERERQESAGIAGGFILPGKYEGKPIGIDAPQKTFAKMIAAEGLDERITLYSLRHTYATELVRHHDLETVRDHLGHSDIRTTQNYLRALKPEERPTNSLRY